MCKKRSKAFNTLKSPNTVNGLHQKSTTKPYKHVKLISLSTIKRVIDIKETEDCQKVFSLVFRPNDELKERLFSFAMTEEDADKTLFLKTLCRQMANNACTADAVNILGTSAKQINKIIFIFIGQIPRLFRTTSTGYRYK